MRYIVSFYHGKSLRVDENVAPAFVQAMKTKDPVLYKGQAFAGASIQFVRPAYKIEAEARQDAQDAGKYRCKYGYTHPNRSDCACRDARFIKVLDENEELLLKEYIQERLPQVASGESYTALVGKVNDGDMIDNSELRYSLEIAPIKDSGPMEKLSSISDRIYKQ